MMIFNSGPYRTYNNYGGLGGYSNYGELDYYRPNNYGYNNGYNRYPINQGSQASASAHASANSFAG